MAFVALGEKGTCERPGDEHEYEEPAQVEPYGESEQFENRDSLSEHILTSFFDTSL